MYVLSANNDIRATGVIRARQPSPSPRRQRARDDVRETDIDIRLDKHRTDVDIRKTTRSRSRSHSRHRHYHDGEIVIRDDARLRVDAGRSTRRRAASMVSSRYDSEADYITGKMDARGHMGEAWGGATRNWETLDVPPGTERVRMDGIGGGRTDTTWSKYSGERRTKFSPDGGGSSTVAAAVVPILKTKRESRSKSRDDRRLSVAVVDRNTEIDVEQTRRRRKSRSRPPMVVAPRDTWTEVSRTAVSREALERLGYPYEESKHCFYIMMFVPAVSSPALLFFCHAFWHVFGVRFILLLFLNARMPKGFFCQLTFLFFKGRH